MNISTKCILDFHLAFSKCLKQASDTNQMIANVHATKSIIFDGIFFCCAENIIILFHIVWNSKFYE